MLCGGEKKNLMELGGEDMCPRVGGRLGGFIIVGRRLLIMVGWSSSDNCCLSGSLIEILLIEILLTH